MDVGRVWALGVLGHDRISMDHRRREVANQQLRTILDRPGTYTEARSFGDVTLSSKYLRKGPIIGCFISGRRDSDSSQDRMTHAKAPRTPSHESRDAGDSHEYGFQPYGVCESPDLYGACVDMYSFISLKVLSRHLSYGDVLLASQLRLDNFTTTPPPVDKLRWHLLFQTSPAQNLGRL
jgi:hypothetical protein